AYLPEDDELTTQLGGFTINRFAADERAGYPTLCKGRFRAQDHISYIFEDPVSLNVLDRLPEIVASGVTALKIEGRQRGKAYVREVVRSFRQGVDAFHAQTPAPANDLSRLSEGQSVTGGAYERQWR